ncbi:MAG: HAD-IB family phosphatase [Nostocaceae cyanobacterium]|nr:HAD-IB family phosphatase [Nostocaceae cyanobacterium]
MSEGKIIIFDCDSTLSSIEGIDELARVAGADVCKQIEQMTTAAMEGKIPLEDVFARRLEILQPSQTAVLKVGELYIQTAEPSALNVVTTFKQQGWTPFILSAGYLQAILPLAKYLGIDSDCVEAVNLFFHEDGSYRDFDRNYPTTRSGGKLEIVKKIHNQYCPSVMVTVGDGVSDLETKPGVNKFVGFGRYAVREKVKAQADYFIHDLAELLSLL